MSQSPTSIEVINPMQDWKWTNMDLMAKMQELTILRSRLASSICVTCSQFAQHVRNIIFSLKYFLFLMQHFYLIAPTNLFFHDGARRITKDSISCVGG